MRILGWVLGRVFQAEATEDTKAMRWLRFHVF